MAFFDSQALEAKDELQMEVQLYKKNGELLNFDFLYSLKWSSNYVECYIYAGVYFPIFKMCSKFNSKSVIYAQ